MRRSRYREEQIIGILKEHEAGLPAAELCRKYGVSDATFYKWRTKYDGMAVSDARRILAFQARYEQIATPFEWTFTRRDLNRLLKRLEQKEARRRAPEDAQEYVAELMTQSTKFPVELTIHINPLDKSLAIEDTRIHFKY